MKRNIAEVGNRVRNNETQKIRPGIDFEKARQNRNLKGKLIMVPGPIPNEERAYEAACAMGPDFMRADQYIAANKAEGLTDYQLEVNMVLAGCHYRIAYMRGQEALDNFVSSETQQEEVDFSQAELKLAA